MLYVLSGAVREQKIDFEPHREAKIVFLEEHFGLFMETSDWMKNAATLTHAFCLVKTLLVLA